MIPELIVGSRALEQGFEFHLALADQPERALCGEVVSPTQIPANFYGVDSAIEGRWCERCERLARQLQVREDDTAPPTGG
jgi:hypothetical protein